MLSANEIDKLAALLNHLHICLGLKFALMDDQAAEVFSSSEQADFCRAAVLGSTPGRAARRFTACIRAGRSSSSDSV